MANELKPIPQHFERGIPLLRAVWEEIKADPTAWRQDFWYAVDEVGPEVLEYIERTQVLPWSCGTPACLAGHVALATGATLPPAVISAIQRSRHGISGFCVLTPDKRIAGVAEYASEVLQINPTAIDALFDSSNDASDIEAMIQELETDSDASLQSWLDRDLDDD